MSSFLSSQALSVAQESLRIENYNITVKERLAEGYLRQIYNTLIILLSYKCFNRRIWIC